MPLGNPKQIEKTKNGEVIYSEEEKIICRYWNYRDCHLTRITENTKKFVFFADITEDNTYSSKETSKSIMDSLSRGLGVVLSQNTSS